MATPTTGDKLRRARRDMVRELMRDRAAAVRAAIGRPEIQAHFTSATVGRLATGLPDAQELILAALDGLGINREGIALKVVWDHCNRKVKVWVSVDRARRSCTNTRAPRSPFGRS
jgi:hypothetical protein